MDNTVNLDIDYSTLLNNVIVYSNVLKDYPEYLEKIKSIDFNEWNDWNKKEFKRREIEKSRYNIWIQYKGEN